MHEQLPIIESYWQFIHLFRFHNITLDLGYNRKGENNRVIAHFEMLKFKQAWNQGGFSTMKMESPDYS